MTAISYNLARQGATEYGPEFAFDSMCVVDGVLYGIRADGIFRIDADKDQGSSINAIVSFGDDAFGSERIKGIITAYAAGEFSGDMQLVVGLEGVEYEYDSRNNEANDATIRFDTGRGLRGNRFPIAIKNVLGADFMLSSLIFVTAESKRRI